MGDTATVELLLAHGANPNIQDHVSIFSFFSFCIVMKYLLSSRCSYLQDGYTALTVANVSLRARMEEIIVSTWHSTSIHKACYDNDLVGLPVLLESLSETSALSVCDKFGWTPLHVSVFFNRLEAVRLLLSKGADILLPTIRGHTALHLACYRGNVDMVRLLISSCSVQQGTKKMRPASY
jgi:hypothetical protein